MQAWVDIAGKHVELTEADKASQLLSQALETTATITDAESKSSAFVRIAERYLRLEQKDQALQATIRSPQDSADNRECDWEKFWALQDIARTYAEAGQQEQALLLLSQATETARTIEDEPTKSMELRSIALTYAEAGDFIQALEIAKTIEDADCKSWALNDIACRIAQLSEKDKAILLDITMRSSHRANRRNELPRFLPLFEPLFRPSCTQPKKAIS